MNILIDAVPLKVETGDFRYGNISSRYGVNTNYFTMDGIPFVPVAGEFHFSRCQRDYWKKELLKMKDSGLNVVSTYVFWNYHEEIKNKFDFSGNKDIGAFLELCKEVDMPCILRIGPWCHGEVIRGGFPKRIARLPLKRKNATRYLREVEDFFKGLYPHVAPYMDGHTVIGIQLENEYTGSTEHIRTLRRMVEKIGYKTPFFTMTAWPSNVPDPEFLPMMGGYPDAPWAMGKKALSPRNRFAIMAGKTEAEIGEDLAKSKVAKAGAYDKIPYACCETGPGNQVTQHRRPLISEKDGYGVCFAKFASGVNWLGYYMYHGGRNPNDRLMQENRLTGYPNNYPIIDYDFQSPISRWGECRPHGDLLRLMHLFISSFDPQIATKQAFFPKWKQNGMDDISFPKCSVRMDETMSGYYFVSTYEKGLEYRDFKEVQVNVSQNGKTISLPSIDIQAGAMFFYPFNWKIGNTWFDYVLAQPVAKAVSSHGMTCYFKSCPGVVPELSVNGVKTSLPLNQVGYSFEADGQTVEIVVLSEERAMAFHLANGKPVFAKGTVYWENNKVICETKDGYLETENSRQEATAVSLQNRISLSQSKAVKLPYNYFLYSHSKRHFYSLKIDPSLFKEYPDVRLEFAFTGMNLQVFSGNTLINDHFNIDGNFVMYLKEYAELLKQNRELIIKAVPVGTHGAANVYMEQKMPVGKVELKLTGAYAIQYLEQTL